MFTFYSGDYMICISYVGKMHSFDVEICGTHSYHVPIKNFSPTRSVRNSMKQRMVLRIGRNMDSCREQCLFSSSSGCGMCGQMLIYVIPYRNKC